MLCCVFVIVLHEYSAVCLLRLLRLTRRHPLYFNGLLFFSAIGGKSP